MHYLVVTYVNRLYKINMHALINHIVDSVNSSKTNVILLPHTAERMSDSDMV